jgi:hypothetical protein
VDGLNGAVAPALTFVALTRAKPSGLKVFLTPAVFAVVSK